MNMELETSPLILNNQDSNGNPLYPQGGIPPQGYPQQGVPPQGYQNPVPGPQGYPQQPQGYPQQQLPPQDFQPTPYSPQGYENFAPPNQSLGPESVRYTPTIEVPIGPPGTPPLQIDPNDLYENTPWWSENKLNLFFTICVFGGLGFFLYTLMHQHLLAAGGAVFGVLALIYYIEASCSGTRKYLSSMTTPEGIHHYIHRIRSTYPRIRFHVECYHHETRHRTRTDADGKTHHETYTEKVVTHRESEEFFYDIWDDVSGQLVGVGDMYRFTRVRFHKLYVFADEYTRGCWENHVQSIQHRNRHRDSHMDFWSTFDIPDYQDRLLAINGDNTDIPTCLGLGWYALCSIFFVGYIYRSWFHNLSTKQSYDFVKRIRKVPTHSFAPQVHITVNL
eukprot:TRINITY_DN4239_c0_g1_i3.p2 TRINITY_DN4239_c0_g1~~TRINITY_DN4239_c0_g1_i3.p2  ORF type:complete len:391 (+),score=20.68 TRINITY_DN4239_c0_g1_i3:40-1212(+)